MSEDLLTRLIADLHDRVRPSNEKPKGPLAKFVSPLDRMTAVDEGMVATARTGPFTWAGFQDVEITTQADWEAGSGTAIDWS